MGRFPDWEQSLWLTRFSRGIVQGGSSGSGLFTLAGGSLQLRAVLTGTNIDASGDLSCTNPTQYGVYNRFDVFHAQVARYLQASPAPVTDDHGNRPAEATLVTLRGAEATIAGRIDYPGDVDVFRLDVVAEGTLVALAGGGADTVGVLLDATGERITSNDDAVDGCTRLRDHAAPDSGHLLPRGHALGIGGDGGLHGEVLLPARHRELHRSLVESRPSRAGASTSTTRATSSSPRCSPTTRAARRCGSSCPAATASPTAASRARSIAPAARPSTPSPGRR